MPIKINQSFIDEIANTVYLLKARDLKKAGEIINQLVVMDINAPQPHNLFGILSELKGDFDFARRHYRAAYALDPTYKPACRNLERLVMSDFETKKGEIDFGEFQTESNRK